MAEKMFHVCVAETPKFNGYNAFIRYDHELEKLIGDFFGVLFEIEFMQGEKINHGDGSLEIRFTCSLEKERAIRDAMNQMQFKKRRITGSDN